MKTKRLPSTERGTWAMIHTAASLVVVGERLPYLHRSPIKLGGRTFEVGTRFVYFGGRKSSAGFETLDFRDAEPMTYAGQLLDQHIADMASPPSRPIGLPLAVFTQGDKPGDGMFYAWHYDEREGVFIFGTKNHAGRIIEHDETAIEGEPGPARVTGKPGKRQLAEAFEALAANAPTFDEAVARFPYVIECSQCWHSWAAEVVGKKPDAIACPECGTLNPFRP